jgi:hypothetical protein
MGSSYWLVLSQEFGNITAKLIRKLIRIVECVNDLPLTLSLKERELRAAQKAAFFFIFWPQAGRASSPQRVYVWVLPLDFVEKCQGRSPHPRPLMR